MYFLRSENKGTLKLTETIELVLGSFGAMQSAFLSAYVAYARKKNTANVLLSLFLVLITFRIVKSLLWVYLDSVPDLILNLGFVAHSASGPMLFLYLIYFRSESSWNRTQLLHFIPSGLLLMGAFTFTEENFWYLGGYSGLLYHQLLYMGLTLAVFSRKLFNRRKGAKAGLMKIDVIWMAILIGGVLCIQLAYFSNYILGLTPYLAGPVIYGVCIFVITFFAVVNPNLFELNSPQLKYRNIQISEEEFNSIQQRIEDVMMRQEPYLTDDFSLGDLSKLIGKPKYLSSHVINKGYATNFSDFINKYRIVRAQDLLLRPENDKIKIAEIAYECGFSSLSAFNAAFKKFTGTTPSNFRRKSH